MTGVAEHDSSLRHYVYGNRVFHIKLRMVWDAKEVRHVVIDGEMQYTAHCIELQIETAWMPYSTVEKEIGRLIAKCVDAGQTTTPGV